MSFKTKYSFEQRLFETTNIIKKYPDRVPLICEKNINCKDLNLKKHKFLVPYDYTVGQFIFVVKNFTDCHPSESIYLFIKGTIPPTYINLGSIYESYKDDDGYLYITISKENTFGSNPKLI